MKNKSKIGQSGEDFVCQYLKERFYKIIDRNFRKTYGEIDIIAIAPDKTLVFIEVKTLNKMLNDNVSQQTFDLTPEDNLNKQKLDKLQIIAQMFVAKHPELINEDKGWRIDLAAVDILTDCDKQFEIRYYENI